MEAVPPPQQEVKKPMSVFSVPKVVCVSIIAPVIVMVASYTSLLQTVFASIGFRHVYGQVVALFPAAAEEIMKLLYLYGAIQASVIQQRVIR